MSQHQGFSLLKDSFKKLSNTLSLAILPLYISGWLQDSSLHTTCVRKDLYTDKFPQIMLYITPNMVDFYQ